MVRSHAENDAIRGIYNMRATSASYNPFPVVREVNFKITFGVTDQNAKKNETVITYNDAGDLGSVRGTVDDISSPGGKYADLERNSWVLDGTYNILPDNAGDSAVGWWSSSISGADGTFATNPKIKYMFSVPISTLGWTLIFDTKSEQYASRVKITAYGANGSTVIDTGEYTISEPYAGIQHYVGDYYGVEIEFLETSEPYRRVRLTEIDFGLTKFYDRNSISEAEITYGADIISSSLPTRELVLSFDNSDKQYNLLNPDGVYQYLQDGQTIDAVITINGEDISMGTFYFTSADVSKSAIVPRLIANDRIWALDGQNYDGGRDETITLEAAIAEVLSGYNIPVSYSGGAASVAVVMAIPQKTKIREAVRLLAQAAMCTVYIDRDNTMRFTQFSINDIEDGEITNDELYDYSGVSIAEKIDGVRLSVSNEYRVSAGGESTGTNTTYSSGEGELFKSVSNPCVADENGQAVADWLLAGFKCRKRYAVKNRCDPAVEIGDTLKIWDIFDNRENAVVTGINLRFNGGLYAITEATGK